MRTKGFTLIEAIIVIFILGVIGALLAPSIKRAIPNSYFHLFRKAYTTVSQVCSELTNDSVIYPDGDLSKSPCPDTTVICPCNPKNFKGCFISKVNTISSDDGNGYFTTDDGISWKSESISWDESAPTGICDDYNNIGNAIEAKANIIMVDLNGTENGPNACGHDRFYFGICRNGKIFISEKCDENNKDDMSGEETYEKATEYLNRLKKQID